MPGSLAERDEQRSLASPELESTEPSTTKCARLNLNRENLLAWAKPGRVALLKNYEYGGPCEELHLVEK